MHWGKLIMSAMVTAVTVLVVIFIARKIPVVGGYVDMALNG